MATTALVETTAQVGEPYRWRRQEYEKMVEIGLFPPQARLELIEGEILHMASQTSYHASALSKAVDALRLIFRAGYHVRSQMPLALSDFSEPEPDIAIVPGTPDDYWDAHPQSAVLIVEVAYSSIQYDRERKLAIYARRHIPEYWIINLNEHRLEIYRQPEQKRYQEVIFRQSTDTVAPLAAPNQSIPVADILPRPRHRGQGG